MCDAAKPAPSVELVDIDGDEIVFSIIDTKLQMFVNGDFVCEDVDTLEYATSDGRVRQNISGACAILRSWLIGSVMNLPKACSCSLS